MKKCEEKIKDRFISEQLTNGGMRNYTLKGIKWYGKGFSTNHDPLRHNKRIKGT